MQNCLILLLMCGEKDISYHINENIEYLFFLFIGFRPCLRKRTPKRAKGPEFSVPSCI